MSDDDMELEDYPLEPIVEYEMDALQAKAYKMMLLWMALSKKAFPDYRFGRYVLPKGDPRKTITWKYCYKAVRELAGKLPDHELKLYVWAQLQILKAITDNGAHPLIDAGILTGPKAWARWCVWKKRWDMRSAAQTVKQVEINEEDGRMVAELDRTKKHLEKCFGHLPTFDEMKTALETRAVIRWAKLKQVSPYYLLLSPWIKKLVTGDMSSHFEMDLTQYHPSPAAEAHFRKIFADELK